MTPAHRRFAKHWLTVHELADHINGLTGRSSSGAE